MQRAGPPRCRDGDDTDPIERLEIQTGTSMVYSAISMEGNLGYELDLTGLAQEEKEEIRRQIHFYKKIRSIMQEGDLYRLRSAGNERAWMYVTEKRLW